MKKLLLLLFLFTAFGAYAQEDPKKDSDTEITEEDMHKMESAIEAMFGGSDIDVLPEYHFNFEYQILMTDYNSYKGKTVQNITMKFNEAETLMGMEMKEENDEETYVGVVFNYSNKEAVTMTEQNGMKIGFAMKIPDLTEISEDYSDDQEMPKFVATGETEMVAGFLCDIKKAVDGTKEYTVWVAQDKSALPTSAFTAFSEMNGKSNIDYLMNGDNCILKMKEATTSGDTFSTFEVTDIKGETKSTISTAGFDFSGLMMGK